MDALPNVLLHELRLGERDAFVRYYELYRASVYDLVRRLLHDQDDAVLATEKVFTTAYRWILLHDDDVDLRERTYIAALDVCRERLGERAAERGASNGQDAHGRHADSAIHGTELGVGAGSWERSDLGRRFSEALETLQFRYQAVLLLHDISGLRTAELAIVFGVTADAAGALLFRAREEFRRAFDELSSDRRTAKCRLAELTASGAVGRSLPDDEVRRLDQHVGYCRQCRQTTKGWGSRALGLALLLDDSPLPQKLEMTPVFGTVAAIVGTVAVAGARPRTRVFARIGRRLTSRAAAYALAAACLALSVGLAVHQSPGNRPLVTLPALGSSVALSAQQATRVVRPPLSVSGHTGVTSARVAAHSSVGTSTRPANALPAVVESSVDAAVPAVTLVADAGGSANDGTSTLTTPEASKTGTPRAVTHDGDADDGANATTDGHVSADAHVSAEGHTSVDPVGHTEATSGGHVQAAETHDGTATKRVKEGTAQHASQGARDHEGKHSAHKKSRKDH
jgi:DNA-directed RNA polymerase specialized sigma24 family protein